MSGAPSRSPLRSAAMTGLLAVALAAAHGAVRVILSVVLIAVFGWDTPPQGVAAAWAAALDGTVTALTLPERAFLAAFPALGWEEPGLLVAALNSLLYGVAGAVAVRSLWRLARRRRSRAPVPDAEPGAAVDRGRKAGPGH